MSTIQTVESPASYFSRGFSDSTFGKIHSNICYFLNIKNVSNEIYKSNSPILYQSYSCPKFCSLQEIYKIYLKSFRFNFSYLKIWFLTCDMYHMACVLCHMTNVTIFFKSDKMVHLVGWGSVIIGATPSSLVSTLASFILKSVYIFPPCFEMFNCH